MTSIADLRQILHGQRPDCPACNEPMNPPSPDAPGRWHPSGRLDARYTCGNGQCDFGQLTLTLHPDRLNPAPATGPQQHPTTSNGGTMSTATSTPASAGSATVEVNDVETADAALDSLDDTLKQIDDQLQGIDTQRGDAVLQVEQILWFLTSKNVDATAVGGVTTALDMLSPDRLHELFTAVDAARAGVQQTREALAPLRDARDQLNGADGSVLNGR